jgi:biuret amidohydrolase
MAEGFATIAAEPYRWPFDGGWSSADSALLLLGFQQGVANALYAAREVEVAARLAGVARSAGIRIVVTRRGQQGGLSPVAARRAGLGEGVPRFGSIEWRLVDSLPLDSDTLIVDHAGDNAFYATGLGDWLSDHGIRNLLIAGLPTEGLVHASMRAANDRGFECLAISDAGRGTNPKRHAAQLRMTAFGNGLFGAHARSEAVLEALSGIL